MVFIFILICAGVCVYYFFFKHPKENKRIVLNEVFIDIDLISDHSFVSENFIIKFFKPIGKNELHAFTGIQKFTPSTSIYLGKLSQSIANKLLGAINNGGATIAHVKGITKDNKVIFQYSADNYGLIGYRFDTTGGLTQIEKNFEEAFQLELNLALSDSSNYKPGFTKQYKEELIFEKWCNNLEKWWSNKLNGLTNEDFEGLYNTKLTMLHVHTYKKLTGEMIPSQTIKDSYKRPSTLI